MLSHQGKAQFERQTFGFLATARRSPNQNSACPRCLACSADTFDRTAYFE